jgi:hypothetical protein
MVELSAPRSTASPTGFFRVPGLLVRLSSKGLGNNGVDPDSVRRDGRRSASPAAGRAWPRRRAHRRRRLAALRRQEGIVPRLHQAVPRLRGRGVHLRHRARREPQDDAHFRRRRDAGGAPRGCSVVRRAREGGVHHRALHRAALCGAGWSRVRPVPLLHEAAAGAQGHLHL